MFSQQEFNRFVKTYNDNYIYLLTRAGHSSYDCLVTSFRMLKDLHDVLFTLHDRTELELQITPYPLTFRGNDELFSLLGFKQEQINRIYGFLDHVRQTQGKEFEECMSEDVPSMCVKGEGV